MCSVELGSGDLGLVEPASLEGSDHYENQGGALVALVAEATGELNWVRLQKKVSST